MRINFGVKIVGKCSSFGGPADTGVKPDEGLALFERVEQMPQIFLKEQPEGTTGLARRLDPETLYCAMRFDYALTPKSVLRESLVMIKNPKNDRHCYAICSDWGPHEKTNRLIDVSPGVMELLDLQTDDVVEATLVKSQSIEV